MMMDGNKISERCETALFPRSWSDEIRGTFRSTFLSLRRSSKKLQEMGSIDNMVEPLEHK